MTVNHTAGFARVLGGAPGFGPQHRDTVTLLVARASGPLVTIGLLALLARRRGAGDVGLYGLAAAVFSILEAASSLGLRHLLPRELARREDPVLLASASVACLLAGAILAVLAAAGAILAGGPAARVILLVAAATPIAAVAVPEEGYWLGVERVRRLSAALLAEQVIRLVGGLLLLANGAGVAWLVALTGIGRLAAVALAWPPGGLPLRSVSPETLRGLARQVPVFLGLEAVFQLYWRVDVLLLSALSSLAEVGFYVAAYRVFSALLLLPQSYGQILLPGMMKEGGEKLLRRGIIDTLMIGVVLGLVAGVGALPLMRCLYGEGFQRAASVLVILSVGMVLASVDQAQGKALVARGRQRLDLSVLAVATACNVGLNLLLIPGHGAVGAAVATLASLMVSVGGHARALRAN
ncbi:MAG: polysaccharide biosynthesis C-terminal domain-containing protein [Candidatus Eisenbacteria bacterium]|jgi:O-antigen/teichoic acid export membrane protein|nr:polysaccharide biosynthesis C-terminal domain-containing protein [Candidatus Eisenbacteria bacterium]